MKGEDLFEKLTNIEDDMIQEAMHGGEKKKPVKPSSFKWFAVAVCFGIIACVASFWNGTKEGTLPVLTLQTEFLGSMGFEGYMAYDISDLTNGNPWTADMNLTHLPVIKNQCVYNEKQQVEDPDFALMERLLKETAQSIGMDTKSLSVTDDAPDEAMKKAMAEKLGVIGEDIAEEHLAVGRLFLEDETYQVKVDTKNTVDITFQRPVPLPEIYNFTYDATFAEMNALAEYLKETYGDFIGMKNPVIHIYGGDYSYDAKQSYGLSFYEQGANDMETILNYHFNGVAFYGDDHGALSTVRKFYTDLSEVVGEYPIIDAQEALTLLEHGNYMTTVPQAFQGATYVRKTELVYRTGALEKLFMPYYKFYVELPEMKEENGLNHYGAYYVPAIQEEYIETMPVWEGNFN